MPRLSALIALAVLLGSIVTVAAAEPSCGIHALPGTYIISPSGTEEGSFTAYAGMIGCGAKGEFKIRIRYVLLAKDSLLSTLPSLSSLGSENVCQVKGKPEEGAAEALRHNRCYLSDVDQLYSLR